MFNVNNTYIRISGCIINVPLSQSGKKRERITMKITRVPYSTVYLFHPNYIPQNNITEIQYFAYSTDDNTLTLSYYLDLGVNVNTTPGNTVNVLPGNDICIYYRSGKVYIEHRTFELSDTDMTI